MTGNPVKRKIDFILLGVTASAAVAVVAGIILQAAIKPDEFGNIGCFLYWLKTGGIAAVYFPMIIVGLYKIRLRENLKFSAICFGLGLSLCLINGLGGIYKYQLFTNFLGEKKQLIEKISNEMKSDELCEYSLTLAKSIYYLKGELTTYSTCDGKTLNFSPTNMDIDQHNHVLLIEKKAERAKDRGIFFFVVLIIAVLFGLIFPKRPKTLQ